MKPVKPSSPTPPSDSAPPDRTVAPGPSPKDFRDDPREILTLSALAVPVGLLAGLVAWALVRMIGLFTHMAYDGTFRTSLVQPDPWHLGLLSIFIPVAGGLVVGYMARYGSPGIRGHGIPEALEISLTRESRISPRTTLFKPIASAVAIGTGGPFGAEGPIIMTGGAIGSIVAQLMPFSPNQRRTLLGAGAAAGMAAVFGTPIAAVLLGVELFLMEFRPRSLWPTIVSVAIAYALRIPLLGSRPLLYAAPHLTVGLPEQLWGGLAVAVAAGLLAVLLTRAVYVSEDLWERLPIHWMWYPALAGLIIGVGGLIEPAALGVGYPVIRLLAAGHGLLGASLVLLVVKGVIWSTSLASGTSGGVLAPLLVMGSALGTALGLLLPGHDPGVWAVVGMAAAVSGGMGIPLTAAVFALETTGDSALTLPILLSAGAAFAVTLFFQDRSLLTEKIWRRDTQVTRELGLDPLKRKLVRDLLQARATPPPTQSGAHLPAIRDTATAYDAAALLAEVPAGRRITVVDGQGQAVGRISRRDVFSAWSAFLTEEKGAPPVLRLWGSRHRGGRDGDGADGTERTPAGPRKAAALPPAGSSTGNPSPSDEDPEGTDRVGDTVSHPLE